MIHGATKIMDSLSASLTDKVRAASVLYENIGLPIPNKILSFSKMLEHSNDSHQEQPAIKQQLIDALLWLHAHQDKWGQVSDARVELDMCLFKYTHTQQYQAAKWRIQGFRQLTMPGTVLSTVTQLEDIMWKGENVAPSPDPLAALTYTLQVLRKAYVALTIASSSQ